MHRLRAQKQTLILVAILLGLTRLALFGATVTATYTPESPIYMIQSPDIFTHSSIAGAKLGTITITSDGPIYNPGLMTIGDFSSGIQMQADYKTWEGGTYSRGTFNFFIVSVAYPNGRGGTPVIDTPYGDKWPMLGANTGITVNTSPFYVDLYLLNGNPGVTYNPAAVETEHPLASLIRFESPITFVDPFNPFFTIGVGSSSSNGVYNYATGAGGSLSNPNNGSYVPIDGVSGANSTPLVDTGGFTGSEGNDDGFWYGEDIPLPLNFLFSFLNNTVSFTLSEAYGNSRKTINTARMEVQNGQNGTTYAQNLTFTDSTNAASFQLSPTTGDGLPIDFKLFFGTTEITKGSAFSWSGLTNGMNTKDLRVGAINSSLVEQRVGGAYKDTITVNITAGP